MPSWNDGESSCEENLFLGDGYSSDGAPDVPNTLHDSDFCGIQISGEAKCDHLEKLARYVAFEGEFTGRRFLGCARPGGGICSTVNWIDPEWPPALKKCLVRLWELYDEECSVRTRGAVEQAEEYYKLNQVKKELELKVKELQIDLGKALMDQQVLDQIQNQLNLNYEEKQKAEMQINHLLAENKALQEMKEEAEKNRDVLKADKKKLEYYIADLLKVAHVSKDKFKKIREILDE